MKGYLINISSNLVSHLVFLSQVFNTSLAEPVPEGYEDVSNIVPPYSAFSAKGQPEVHTQTTLLYSTDKKTVWFKYIFTVVVK